MIFNCKECKAPIVVQAANEWDASPVLPHVPGITQTKRVQCYNCKAAYSIVVTLTAPSTLTADEMEKRKNRNK